MRICPVPRMFAIVAIGVMLVLGGCAAGAPAAWQARAASRDVTLLLRNDNWLNVTIYALRGGARFRVGTVNGMSRERFRLARDLYGPSGHLRLLVDPAASDETFTTELILLGEVQQIEWTVTAHLPNSRLLLR